MAKMLVAIASQELKKRFRSLRQLVHDKAFQQLAVYNTEATGSVHLHLAHSPSYVVSEYFGEQYSSGETVNSILNEDLQNLSFDDNSFHYVLSSDVFEHIPNPYLAHEEVYRVLKPGGRHIFTVPFHQADYCDEVLARLEDGDVKLEKPPVYHADPIRSEGILVFRIFSLEMLIILAKIGYRTNMHRIYQPSNGILGPNGLVFEAVKPESPA